jgi:hypothetical protein
MKHEAAGLGGDWRNLSDEELVHRIEGLGKGHGADSTLMDIVGSRRHFFVRQAAARRIEDSKLLHEHWDDRHIGQILVRGLSRAEDIAYLEKLKQESRYSDVRAAAEEQLRLIEGLPKASGSKR